MRATHPSGSWFWVKPKLVDDNNGGGVEKHRFEWSAAAVAQAA